jgi:hypothetical protein
MVEDLFPGSPYNEVCASHHDFGLACVPKRAVRFWLLQRDWGGVLVLVAYGSVPNSHST